jgi:hypothetical protein
MASTATKHAPSPAPANAQTTLPTSRLAAAKRGRLQTPLRILTYGIEGAGKSTLFAGAPDPLWLDIEDGTARLDVTRYPFREGPDGHVPNTYAEVVAAVDDLTRSQHAYKTLVIDTADRLEALLWQHIVARDNATHGGKLTSVESYGYGKGYQVAVDEWRFLCSKLDRLRMARGMTVVLLAHSLIRNFKNPESSDYDRYQLAVNEKAGGFLKGWSDVVGFLRFEEGASKAGERERARGWSTGKRILHLSRSAAYDAKGRGGMPDELEIPPSDPWGALAAAIEQSASTNPEQLTAAIAAEVERIGDPELKPKVDDAVADAIAKADTDALHRYLNDLKRRPQRQAA